METGNISSLQLGSVETFPPWGVLGLGVSKYFDPKKSDKKILSQFRNILNFIKSSCITFCGKLF